MPTARVAPHSSPSKAALRRVMRARRAGCDPGAGTRLGDHLLGADMLRDGEVVAGFWPLPGEIDIRPLLVALAQRGYPVALPAIEADAAPLSFHRWQDGAALVREARGTWRPAEDPVTPDVVLVPLLAFDRAGGRLGYGGGFYDRTLAQATARMAIGCAFAAQEVEAVPVEAHDRRLDAVATENGVIIIR